MCARARQQSQWRLIRIFDRSRQQMSLRLMYAGTGGTLWGSPPLMKLLHIDRYPLYTKNKPEQ